MRIFRYKGYERKKFLIRYSNILLVASLIFVTGWYAYCAHRMLSETRRQFEIMNRPYLEFAKINLSIKHGTLKYEYYLYNNGMTPAVNPKIVVGWIPGEPSTLILEGKHAPAREIKANKYGRFDFSPNKNIGLGQPDKFSFKIQSPRTIDQLMEQEEEVILLLKVVYQGIINRNSIYSDSLKYRYLGEKIGWIPAE